MKPYIRYAKQMQDREGNLYTCTLHADGTAHASPITVNGKRGRHAYAVTVRFILDHLKVTEPARVKIAAPCRTFADHIQQSRLQEASK